MTALFRHNGLTLALAGLFAFSLIGHAATGYVGELEDLRAHGQSALSFVAYLAGGTFLSSLFENWESEFLSTAVLIVLAIFLRERRSPESKPVGAPVDETGT